MCRSQSCLARAIKQKQLERQLEVQLTPEVAQFLLDEMERLKNEPPEEAEG